MSEESITSVEQVVLVLLVLTARELLLDVSVCQPVKQQISSHFLILVTRQVSLGSLYFAEAQS